MIRPTGVVGTRVARLASPVLDHVQLDRVAPRRLSFNEGGHCIDYVAYLLERYQGEVYGEALFRTLAQHTADSQARYKWKTLEQLERETKERIRSALEKLGCDPSEDLGKRALGERHGEQLASRPRLDFMNDFRAELERIVAKFEEAERQCPPDGRELLRHITKHERALLDFTVLEIGGRTEDSVGHVLALLEQPPLSP